MNIIDYYNSFEIASYQNYQINHKHNFFLFNELCKLENLFSKNNIRFVITGSLSLVLHYKKIYRKINDLDIIINNRDIFLCLSLLRNSFNIISDNDLGKNIIDFRKNKHNTIVLKPKSLKYKLDLINYNQSLDEKVYITNIEEVKYYYKLPWIGKLDRKSKKDIDDINFYIPDFFNKKLLRSDNT
jgi:hypothetical protein